MDRLAVKHRLLDRGLTLAEVARQAGIPYDRLVRLVNGYREARQEELERIAQVLDLSLEALNRDGEG